MSISKLKREAQKLCRHTVVFTDPTDILAAVRAMQGRTTKAIARELGISAAQAQYRIQKAQRSMATKFRSDYRNGNSPLATQMLTATEGLGMAVVSKQIAPKFIPLASAGVPKTR
jgi:DNA-binding transcriptional regulator LsrR (DeoR family)